nr:hypothetical protein [uncultured bacterium]
MNKNIILTSAIAAGTAAIIYLVKKRRSVLTMAATAQPKRSHHRTNIFAMAKQGSNTESR